MDVAIVFYATIAGPFAPRRHREHYWLRTWPVFITCLHNLHRFSRSFSTHCTRLRTDWYM